MNSALRRQLETLKSEVAQGTDAFDLLGKVFSLEDSSASKIVPVTAPLDRNGNPILGWFTREGDQVDIDDIFLFADHFGTKQRRLGYDTRFDLVANGRIDFGKVVANASVISGNWKNEGNWKKWASVWRKSAQMLSGHCSPLDKYDIGV